MCMRRRLFLSFSCPLVQIYFGSFPVKLIGSKVILDHPGLVPQISKIFVSNFRNGNVFICQIVILQSVLLSEQDRNVLCSTDVNTKITLQLPSNIVGGGEEGEEGGV